MSLHENEDPIYGLDVVPFLATSFDQAKKLWDVQRPAVEKKLASQGLDASSRRGRRRASSPRRTSTPSRI